jgi:hypothetical protein
MSSILSRVAAVGIIAGGFALTGDLGRLAKRGLEVVNSRDVPAARTADDADAPAVTATPNDETSRQVEQVAAAAEAFAHGGDVKTAAPVGVAAGKPALTRDADFRPPQDGIDTIELSSLVAGNRVVVWLSIPRRSGGRAYRCLVFDIVDPDTGEALAYEAVSFAADGSPQATATAPRRVRLQGDGLGGAVAKSGRIDIQRRGVAADGVGSETIGPVAALSVVR